MTAPILDQTAGYSASATPCMDGNGGWHPAIYDATTDTMQELGGWRSTFNQARELARELIAAGAR